MEIGEPKREFTVEPVEDPVPREEPVEQPAREPVRVPDEPDKVPA
jgi:hypothetical protein